MTWRSQISLSDADRAAFSVSAAFIEGRLESRATVQWALRLPSHDTVQRLALLAVLDRTSEKLAEPWRDVWRLIEEFWDQPLKQRSSTEAYRLKRRLAEGERSGALVAKAVELLAPRLNLGAWTEDDLSRRKIPKRPRLVSHVLSASLTSNELVAPATWGIAAITETAFLAGFARSLEGALASALDTAKRLGWDGATQLWAFGQVRCVYHADRPGEERSDPDQHGRGIAGCTKMLHAVVTRLAEVSPPEGLAFLSRWRGDRSPIFKRLWAALAFSEQLASADDVGAFLTDLDQTQFWDLHKYPEIAELRARRFGGLSNDRQAVLITRLIKGPPRSQWGRESDDERVERALRYWSVRELRRIEVSGSELPPKGATWLAANVGEFEDLAAPIAINEGFLAGVEVRSHHAVSDDRYNEMSGEARLRALQAALTAAPARWDDDPADGARAWTREHENTLLVLSDLETSAESGSAFPAVWETFGWSHSPKNPPIKVLPRIDRDVPAEASRVLVLLAGLTDQAIADAVSGICNWLSVWEDEVVADSQGLQVWSKIWPIAVEATNAEAPQEDELDLGVVARGGDDREPMDLDTLNTSAGKLVGVFLAAWRATEKGAEPFAEGAKARVMRDVIIDTPGRSGLIAKHRMIEFLSVFQNADPAWTDAHLLPALTPGAPESAPLWRSVARRRVPASTIKLLGENLLKQALEPSLGRETRKSLVFSIVVESLHAIYAKRDQPVPFPRLQQLLRALDDEVRAHAAEAVQRFVRDNTKDPHERYFREAAGPFMREIWPQERSLSTPGISSALADLPAASGEAFAEAVGVIERFLVPFDCWSLLEYGLYGEDEAGAAKLSSINSPEKAQALLTLLDRTVGVTDGSVIPHGLADALAQILAIGPALEATQAFRRLSTAAR